MKHEIKPLVPVNTKGLEETARALLEGKAETPEITDAQDKENFIYVPSVNVYFAEERSCLGNNWHKTHEELQKKGLRMPTIPEFIGFLKYLRDNPSDKNTKIYNGITEVRDPWRAEWLDADFKVKNNELYINYRHEFKNGVLVPKYSEKLESCLMKDKTPGIDLNDWINNPTKQGLPKPSIKKGGLYYWCPRSDNNSVARFYADSDRADLYCYRNPGYANASLGVFGCCEAAQKN